MGGSNIIKDLHLQLLVALNLLFYIGLWWIFRAAPHYAVTKLVLSTVFARCALGDKQVKPPQTTAFFNLRICNHAHAAKALLEPLYL